MPCVHRPSLRLPSLLSEIRDHSVQRPLIKSKDPGCVGASSLSLAPLPAPARPCILLPSFSRAVDCPVA